MDRRRFLGLVTTLPAVVADRLGGLQQSTEPSGSVDRSRQLSPPVRPSGHRAFAVEDLLANGKVPLGTRGLRAFYVSFDDIEDESYLEFAATDRNALVISAYASDKGAEGALLRAVSAKLRSISPHDYGVLIERLSPMKAAPRERILPFELAIPLDKRPLFPVDDLLVVPFEEGTSDREDFEWVAATFEVGQKRAVANLIVPCLGRNWRDRHTIEFEKFFETFLDKVPSATQPPNVYLSLYSQWPSFELQDACESLNRAWAKVLLKKGADQPFGSD